VRAGPNPLDQPPVVAAGLTLMLAMLVGFIIAWRWEVAGAVTTLGALAAFNIINFVRNGRFLGGAFPLFAVPPALHLIHAIARRAFPQAYSEKIR
jgi:hypothetical protein